jgi:hypothetical protein
MAGRRLILGLMLLLQVAFSLLGIAGTHIVLGCQHHHEAGQPCASHEHHTHSHHGCKHAHRQTDPQPEEPAPAPLRDDDCAICQLFTRPVEVAVVFCWENVEVQAEALVTAPTVQLTSFFESGYEVRGPPTSV